LDHARQALSQAACRGEQRIDGLQRLDRPGQHGKQGHSAILILGHARQIEGTRFDQARHAK
jgi:hypothetical protein